MQDLCRILSLSRLRAETLNPKTFLWLHGRNIKAGVVGFGVGSEPQTCNPNP